jgi:site-specific DNA recombinase
MELVSIYVRLSDEDRGKECETQDSESIQNQKTMLIDYAMKNGWNIYNIYSDDDYSGADGNRPRYNQLLKDAEDGKFNIVLCKSQSRFTRDMEHVERYIHGKFNEWGIRFIGVTDNADTDIKGNKKSRQINGLVNEWYLEDASENIKAALISKMKQGQFIGAFAPYGYKKDPQNKNKLVIDDEAAEVVRLIFKMYLEGCGVHYIARYLNEKAIPCPSAYKKLIGLNYKNTHNNTGLKLWEMTTVHFILTNQAYAGDIVQNKIGTVSYKNQKKTNKPKIEWISVKDVHEPIIDRMTYNKISELAGLRKRPRQTGRIDKYSGKLRCGVCGEALYRNGSKGSYKGKERPKIIQYRCKINKSSRNHCSGSCITEKVLDNFVLHKINDLIQKNFEEAEINSLISEKDNDRNTVKDLENQKDMVRKQINGYEKALTNLYLDKVKEVIQEDMFSILSRKLVEEKENAEDQLRQLSDLIAKIESSQKIKVDKQNIVSKYNKVEQLDRIIIDTFIDYISIKNTGMRNLKEVEIHWNF